MASSATASAAWAWGAKALTAGVLGKEAGMVDINLSLFNGAILFQTNRIEAIHFMKL
jgi:hypothetical protein